MSSLQLAIIVAIINVIRSETVTTPTSGNATHQYFDTSTTTLYTSDSIVCGAPYCHIICDEPSGCYDANIDASASDTLIVECSSTSSCEKFNITAGPTTNLNVYCTGDTKSCKYGNIKALTTTNIDVFCNDTNTNLATACMYLKVITAQASSLNMECVSSHSCFQAGIVANAMDGTLNLICSGDNACDQLTVGAENMGTSSVVHVLCDTASNITQACETTFIKCPEQGTCNIDCISPGGCYNAQITIPNEDYTGLNLNCADTFADDACINSDFVCSDTAKTSALVYDTTYSRWTCDTYGCCPFKDGDPQSCASGTDCEIQCDSGKNCKNSIINGSLANSLTVNCIGTRCDGSLILCPFSDNSACTILCNGTAATGGPCDETLIHVGNGNIMDSFSMYCNYAGGAYDESGCARAEVVFNAASITNVIVDATGSSDARYMQFSGDSIIENFNIDCDECEYSTFDLKISGSVTANCKWAGACYRMESTFTSTTNNVNYFIYCNNLDGSQPNSRACSYAKWWFHGYNDTANDNQRTNNITVQCQNNECYATRIYGYSLLNADVNCIGSLSTEYSACWYGIMDFASTQSFNLNCVGYWTCRETEIFCPYSDPNSCHIDCDSSTGSCRAMEIYVPDSYTWNYLDLNCAASGVCDLLNVNCNQGGRSQAVYIWDSTALNYRCTDDSALYCCPYYNSTNEVGGCSSGTSCTVDCASASCANQIIDGSEASYLNVSCGGTQNCYKTLIHCPVGGCNVLCNGTRACEYASIVYGGTINDRGKVRITCEDYYACHQTLMDMNFVDELVLSCNGNPSASNRVCYGLNFEANYANKVIINALERYAMEDYSSKRYLYMRYAGDITINAKGFRALQDHYIYAQHAAYLEVNAAADGTTAWPLYNNYFYMPYNTTFNLYGYGGRQLGYFIQSDDTSDGLQINLDTCEVCDGTSDCIYDFTIHCKEYTLTDYFNYGSCDSNVCGCEDLMNRVSVTTVYEEENCYTPRSIQTCSGQCTFDCDIASANDCADYILDGRGASALTVNCGDSYYCQDTIVYCPDSGCTVTCDAASACNGAIIIYEGAIVDGGTVEINCNDWTNACYDMEFDAQNAQTVTINGNGADSMVSSILRADNAQTVTITLAADSGTSTTQSMQWYIPQSTTFNCFGTGCLNLNQIYRGSISTSTGLTMNIASCAQCTSATSCLEGFNISCNAGVDIFSSNDPCTSDNICGCSDVVTNNIAFTPGYEDAGCLTANTVQTCQSNKDCVVDCTSSTCANEVIDGQAASSLTVNCGSNGYCGGTFIHCPTVGCDINCVASSTCTNTKILYDGVPADNAVVRLECDGNTACNNMIVNTETAASLVLNLISDSSYSATSAMSWYIPQNTSFNCFGTGCKNLNEIYRGSIINADVLSFNIETCNQCDTLSACLNTFDLNCVDGEDLFDSGLCKDRSTHNTCGCNDVIRNNTQFERTYQGARCSVNKVIEVCTEGVPCIRNCDDTNGNCTGKVIDAKLATHLSVYCDKDYYCQNAIFECPVSGCSVVCNASFACENAKVIYDGHVSDAATVEVDCLQTKSCRYLSITAPEAYEVDLKCIGVVGVNNYACYYLELNADFANKVLIRASEKYASSRDIWNVRYAKNVILDGRGTGTSAYVMHYTELFANYADYVEINLASDVYNTYVTYYTNLYIPLNTTFNCFGFGCYYLYELQRGDITTGAGLQFNVDTCGVCPLGFGQCVYDFDLNCVVGGSSNYDSYYGASLCASYNTCGCRDAMRTATFTTDHREQRCLTPNTVRSCAADVPCAIHCNSGTGTCAYDIIDASLASDFSLYCTDDYHCQHIIIYCPDSGCNIVCNASSACDGMQVFYEGDVSDNGVMDIYCDGEYACRYMEVAADTIYTIGVTCRGTLSACYAFVANADNANQVTINSFDNQQDNNGVWNVKNVSLLTVNGRGQHSFYYTDIKADNAGAVEINLVGDGTLPSASFVDWYLPKDSNTVFNCYGTACLDLGNIYNIFAASALQINIETCGQCNDISDCLDSFTMQCSSGQDSFASDHCATANLCGCMDLVQNNIQITTTYGEPNCYSTFTRSPTALTLDPTSTTDISSTTPTSNPTTTPSSSPVTSQPSSSPTQLPTLSPITSQPTSTPSASPSSNPTTSDPTRAPIIGTRDPTSDTSAPTSFPTSTPSETPTSSPVTLQPSSSPSKTPTSSPIVGTLNPSASPSSAPTTPDPTAAPFTGTLNPTLDTIAPTLSPQLIAVTPDPTEGPVSGSLTTTVDATLGSTTSVVTYTGTTMMDVTTTSATIDPTERITAAPSSQNTVAQETAATSTTVSINAAHVRDHYLFLLFCCLHFCVCFVCV